MVNLNACENKQGLYRIVQYKPRIDQIYYINPMKY
jgi:hypothetical protein